MKTGIFANDEKNILPIIFPGQKTSARLLFDFKVIYRYLDVIPKQAISAIGVLLVIVLGIIDHVTGYELASSILYLLPIFFVSWFGEKNQAVIICALSAATWLLADLTSGHIYSHPLIPLWNFVMTLVIFLLVSFLLSKVKKMLEKERTSARIDFLTGITNSRAFKETAADEISRCDRFTRPVTIAYIDIDDFKQVNDTLGHSRGDALLRMVAKTIEEHTRSMDIVSRLGGDEFAILFPETDEEKAKSAVHKVQSELFSAAKHNGWPVTFSIGAVTCYQTCDLDELIKKADNLMYFAKRSGKNRVVFDVHEIPAG